MTGNEITKAEGTEARSSSWESLKTSILVVSVSFVALAIMFSLLAVFGAISGLTAISFSIVALLLGVIFVIIHYGFKAGWFSQKPSVLKRSVSLEQARSIALGMLKSQDIAEKSYCPVLQETMKNCGRKGFESPVYVRIMDCVCEPDKWLAICVNCVNKDTAFEFFQKKDYSSFRSIYVAVERMANKLVGYVAEESDQEEEIENKPDGTRIVRKRKVKNSDEKDDDRKSTEDKA